MAVAARKPVGNSASSAQAEALAVPALAVFQRSARQLTKFQQKTLLWLGLVTLGPKDTAGDGECMYRAISQQLSMLQPERGTIWTLQHSEQAQSGFPGLRIKAAEEVSSNAWLQQRLISDSALLVSKSAANPNHADILKKAMRRKAPSALPDVLAAKVKIPIAEGAHVNLLDWSKLGHVECSPKVMYQSAKLDPIQVAFGEVTLRCALCLLSFRGKSLLLLPVRCVTTHGIRRSHQLAKVKRDLSHSSASMMVAQVSKRKSSTCLMLLFIPPALLLCTMAETTSGPTYKQHEVYGHEAPNLFEVKTKCDLRLWPKSSLTALPNTTADVMESPVTEARTAASSFLQLGQAAVSRPRRSQRS